MVLRLILWDFDGTLADTAGDVWHSLSHAARAMGGALPEEWTHDPTKLALSVGELYRGVTPYPGDERFEAFDELVRVHYRTVSTFPSSVLYPGIEALLGAMAAAGVASHIVTNKPRQALERLLSFKGWGGLFSGISCADDHGPGEQDLDKASMIAAALSLRGVAANETIMVGDSAGDIVGARRVGVDSIGVTWGDGDTQALLAANPTHRVDDVAALAVVIEARRGDGESATHTQKGR